MAMGELNMVSVLTTSAVEDGSQTGDEDSDDDDDDDEVASTSV